MEQLLEDEYEDQLIDAFDASSNAAASPRGAVNSHPQQPQFSLAGVSHEQPTKLYPEFDDIPGSNPGPVASAAVANQLAIPASPPKKSDGPIPMERSQRTHSHLVQQQEQEVLTSEELLRRRRQIEHEMREYQERFNYVAKALAGETPHQIEERKKREEERLGRLGTRAAATEMRLQHQVEQLQRREERKARNCARHHRASRSLSPCGSNYALPDEGNRLSDL